MGYTVTILKMHVVRFDIVRIVLIGLGRALCDVVMGCRVTGRLRVVRARCWGNHDRLGKHSTRLRRHAEQALLSSANCHNAPRYALGATLVHSRLPLFPLTTPFIEASLFFASSVSVAHRFRKRTPPGRPDAHFMSCRSTYTQ
jgi:ribosomal protein L35